MNTLIKRKDDQRLAVRGAKQGLRHEVAHTYIAACANCSKVDLGIGD